MFKTADFLFSKIADDPTLTYKLADFPDNIRSKLADYYRPIFKLADDKVIFFTSKFQLLKKDFENFVVDLECFEIDFE